MPPAWYTRRSALRAGGAAATRLPGDPPEWVGGLPFAAAVVALGVDLWRDPDRGVRSDGDGGPDADAGDENGDGGGVTHPRTE